MSCRILQKVVPDSTCGTPVLYRVLSTTRDIDSAEIFYSKYALLRRVPVYLMNSD